MKPQHGDVTAAAAPQGTAHSLRGGPQRGMVKGVKTHLGTDREDHGMKNHTASIGLSTPSRRRGRPWAAASALTGPWLSWGAGCWAASISMAGPQTTSRPPRELLLPPGMAPSTRLLGGGESDRRGAALHHARGAPWGRALPPGYGLSLAGAGVFAASGVGDLLWHLLFGIEARMEALLSPTHVGLTLGLAPRERPVAGGLAAG